MLTTKTYTKFFSTFRSSAELVRRSLLPPRTLNPAPATYPKTLSGATQNLQLRSSSFRPPTCHSPPAVPLHRLHPARLLSAAAGAAAVSDDGLQLQDGNKVTKGLSVYFCYISWSTICFFYRTSFCVKTEGSGLFFIDDWYRW